MNKTYIYLTFWFVAATFVSCQKKEVSVNPSITSEERGNVVKLEGDEISDDDIPFLIGTYTRKEGHVDGKAKGLHLGYLNPISGNIRVSNSYEAGENPSYLVIHPSNKFVFVVNETGGSHEEQYGNVTSLKVNDDYSLELLNQRSSNGTSPCHIALSNQATNVFVANYVTGSITSFPMTMEGKLGGAQNVIRYRGKGPHEKQGYPHAHYIQQLPDGQVVSVDLGTDTIRFHSFKQGQLTEAESYVTTEPGAGPRHIAVHPSDQTLYVLNELNSTISSFRKNADDKYTAYQTVSTLADGGTDGGSAAIKITPNGKFLYATNRGGYNNISIFSIGPEQELELISHQSTLGNVPRDIEISPNGDHLIAANQNSDNLVSYTIDNESGLLKNPKILEGVATPVCIKFF